MRTCVQSSWAIVASMEFIPSVVFSVLFGKKPEPCEVYGHLHGIPTDSAMRFVASLCHRLTAQEQLTGDIDEFLNLQHQLALEFVPPGFRAFVLEHLRSRPEYADGRWAVATPRGVMRLLGAYLAVNQQVVPGPIQDTDFERLATCMFAINELSLRVEPDLGAGGLLHLFEYVRRCNWANTLPRSFRLFGQRLPAAVPAAGEAFERSCGATIAEAVTVLFGLYSEMMAAVHPGKIPPELRPTFRYGGTHRADPASAHAAERLVARVQAFWSADLPMMGKEFSTQELGDPSILPLLRAPFLRVPTQRLWCADPYLLLNAASDGLFWRIKGAFEAQNRRPVNLTDSLGKPVFEDYLVEFFELVKRTDVSRSGKLGDTKGLPDFWMREGDSLIVFEAKAGYLSEAAKYSGDKDELERQLKKLAGESQLAAAIERLASQVPQAVVGVTRVFPVVVTLDDAWGAPRLQGAFAALVRTAEIGLDVAGTQIVPVSDLELAGNWLRAGVLSKLLSWRGQFSPEGTHGIAGLVGDSAGKTKRATGLAFPEFDAQKNARDELMGLMDEVFKQYRAAAAGT